MTCKAHNNMLLNDFIDNSGPAIIQIVNKTKKYVKISGDGRWLLLKYD